MHNTALLQNQFVVLLCSVVIGSLPALQQVCCSSASLFICLSAEQRPMRLCFQGQD